MKMSPQLRDLGISGILKGRSACAEIQLPLWRSGGWKLPYLFYGERAGISPRRIFSTHARTQEPGGFTQPWVLRSLLGGMVLSSYTALWINLQLSDPESPRRCAGVHNTFWPLSFVSRWPSLAWSSLSSAWPAKRYHSTINRGEMWFFYLGQKSTNVSTGTENSCKFLLLLFKHINCVSFRHLLPLPVS